MRNCPHPRVAPAGNAQGRGTAAASWLYAEAVHTVIEYDPFRNTFMYKCAEAGKTKRSRVHKPASARPQGHALPSPPLLP